MALDEAAVSALLDALRAGEGTGLVRELAQWALRQLIDTEATEKIGADPWERTPDRLTYRNGTRPKVGLLHDPVTSDVWCREVLLEGCFPCPSPIPASSART